MTKAVTKRKPSIRQAQRKAAKKSPPCPGKEADEPDGPKKIVAIKFEGKLVRVRVEDGEDLVGKMNELTGGTTGKMLSFACYDDEGDFEEAERSMLSEATSR
jgi:hypothetical protein